MSRKTLIIIFVVLLIFFLALLGYYFIIGNNGTGESGGLSFRSFLPFGGETTVTPEPNTSNQNQNNNNNNQNQNQNDQDFVKALRKLSSEPVSGAGIVNIKAGSVVRYSEKATGHVYEVEMFSPRKERISNTTIPLVYDALWGNNNNSLAIRYLKEDNQTISSYLLNITSATSSAKVVTAIALPENIKDSSVFGNKTFYLLNDADGSSGYLTQFDNKVSKKIWSSDIKELTSQFVNDKTVAINTRPYQDLPGYLYFVDTTTGVVKRVLGGVKGLSSLVNSSANKVLYLEQADEATLHTYNLTDKTKSEIHPVTFPEKCVWGKVHKDLVYCGVPKQAIDKSSLTNWYLGYIQTNDNIWIFDTKTGSSYVIEDLESASGEKIDLIKPVISDNDQYLLFVNKSDNALWSFDLGKVSTSTSNIAD